MRTARPFYWYNDVVNSYMILILSVMIINAKPMGTVNTHVPVTFIYSRNKR